MAKVVLLYEGQKIDIQCDENDKLETIIQRFCEKVQKSKDNLLFLYGGQFVQKNSTFINLANSVDKTRKTISIIVTEKEEDNNALLIKENKELKEKLNKANKTIEEQKIEINELKYKITMVKSEGMNQINSLMETIEKKDKQIKELKEQLKQNKFAEMKTIQFISSDMKVNYSTPCKGTETFSEIEDKLYNQYPEYRNGNNTFLFNGKIIQRFKTINENGIKNGDIIIMMPLEY